MNKTILGILTGLTVIITISACGGGGGGDGDDSTPQPTTAVVTLTTQGTTTRTIGAVQAVLTLPAGVTVKATQNAPQTDAGVVTSSGADLVMGVYAPASGTVTAYIAKTAGIPVGNFAAVSCDIAVDNFPTTTSFSVSDLKTWDTNGVEFTGLSVTHTATIN
jgi:hypothetical protein